MQSQDNLDFEANIIIQVTMTVKNDLKYFLGKIEGSKGRFTRDLFFSVVNSKV